MTLIIVVIVGGIGIIGGLYWAGGLVFSQLVSSQMEQEVALTLGEEGKGKRLSDLKISELIQVKEESDQVTEEVISQEEGNEAQDTSVSEVLAQSASNQVSMKMRDYIDILGSEASLQDMIDYIMSQISAVDRIRISALVVNNIPTSDIEYLASMAVGGYSAEEIAAAKKVARSRFDVTQMEEVYYYYNKYSYLIP